MITTKVNDNIENKHRFIFYRCELKFLDFSISSFIRSMAISDCSIGNKCFALRIFLVLDEFMFLRYVAECH